ncbi:MAG: hypothetical protein IKX48_12095, partial [Victivallales bacterium]|nr:hypothetical protein [Victivallales bacterium]
SKAKEDKSKAKQEGTWSLSYTLRLHCQLYDFDVICNTDGTGWDIIRVDHYFFETFFEEVEKDK